MTFDDPHIPDTAAGATLSPATALARLRRTGWRLLYTPDVATLDTLLQRAAAEPGVVAELEAYRLAQLIEIDDLPHEAMRRFDDAQGADRAVLAWAQARAELMFDRFDSAASHADKVLAALPGDLHPLSLAARYIKGAALSEAGHPAEAIPWLQLAVRGARRDRLLLLELLGLQALARAAEEASETAIRDSVAEAARERAATLAGWRIAQAVRRLPVRRALAALDLRQAQALLDEAGAVEDGYWAFPQQVLHTSVALARGHAAEGIAAWQRLEKRLTLDFYCARWRADVDHLRVWCAGLGDDRETLTRLAAHRAMPAADADLSTCRIATHALAAALWLGQPDVRERAAGLQQCFRARGLQRLARRAQWLCAVSGDTEAMVDWLAASREHDLLDVLWLAPRSARALQHFLRTAGSAERPALRALARSLVEHLASSGPPASALPGTAVPEGLTRKEWQVLQAIAEGWSNEQIAARLHISLATVKTHVNHLYSKLQLSSRDEARLKARHLAALHPAASTSGG
ncbi:LuxR C-terminal-related transcriptional regulator [Caldimonas brevitalea]|uniref:Transcriptional activator of maltose regulon, MalT n=1 Tax=Caldimonas brevitalea TaxID=413882 RepID=A0A0G3BUE1_9BURK|nr:LuxR C-terminal-related transcriptional regulator [Caldimonas brevitalea]AKJ30150.1 transcriptional activator of maltose regulon, MalT [Caldimonas brevitalea]